MRLINIRTLSLEEFITTPPPYVALSHTWENEELTLQEFIRPNSKLRAGRKKVLDFCRTIKTQQSVPSVDYAWVDTCCIDKTSSSELSEALNSMFSWYWESDCCYAFLSDVTYDPTSKCVDKGFEESRWFTRGFTLQELLAPKELKFFDKHWRYIGCKASLVDRISTATNIPQDVLLERNLHSTSLAQKMSWASKRKTTRPEDTAYCLLGIFNVNMPLLYGEGSKAFIRLQEEILKQSDDQTIFAWDASKLVSSRFNDVGALAQSPEFFEQSANISALPLPIGGKLSISNKGVDIELPLKRGESEWECIAILSCLFDGDLGSRVGIPLRRNSTDNLLYTRYPSLALERVFVSSPIALAESMEQITLIKGIEFKYLFVSYFRCLILYAPEQSPHWEWREYYPDDVNWTHCKETSSVTLQLPQTSPSWNLNSFSVTHIFEYRVPPLLGMRFGVKLLLKTAHSHESRVKLINLATGAELSESHIERPLSNTYTGKTGGTSLDCGPITLKASMECFYAHGGPMLVVKVWETRNFLGLISRVRN
ncbi:ankyrin repeat-containing protein [Pochonia chlamydosporia 170]|uniref:Ankyrin repeat-containing protein n=1 Tax=Pochonia chlamydosporia 170 TaxID=1380566 RepID=A0A179F373_METCM|nr:ankyrin repeat-containing protein [Pochonia chlamydosporia 170]OAQ59800.1 ankyrin repeat-containing protein [Pochonia chlamydosporia 170]